MKRSFAFVFIAVSLLWGLLGICMEPAKAEDDIIKIDITNEAYSGLQVQARVRITNTQSISLIVNFSTTFKADGILPETMYARHTGNGQVGLTANGALFIDMLAPGEVVQLQIYAEPAIVTETKVISSFFTFSNGAMRFPSANLTIHPNPTYAILNIANKKVAFKGDELCFTGQFPGSGSFRFSRPNGDFPMVPSSWEADKACVFIDAEVPSGEYSVYGVNNQGIPGNRRALIVGWQEHMPLVIAK